MKHYAPTICLPLHHQNFMEFAQNLIRSSTIWTQIVTIYTWYHDPRSSGSPVILFTRLLYYIKCQSRKREIIQPNIYSILPKFNQIICTLYTICMPNIMILSQAVLHIYLHDPLKGKCLTLKGNNPAKYSQAIYTMYSNCMTDIMIFPQVVLQLFYSHVSPVILFTS